MTIPEAEARYLADLVARLRDLLGPRLIGVYPTGSVALDGYRPGRSDLDVVAVAERLTPADVAAVAAGLSHGALPCPATGLEFVLYDRGGLVAAGTGAGFALNLNTGRQLPAKAETGPGEGPAFWYPIDRDIIHQQGRVLFGPPFGDLVPRLPHPTLLPVVAGSIEAHRYHVGEYGDNAVLNGCRALCFGTRGRWYAKPDAARWAISAVPGFAPLIAEAFRTHARDRAHGSTVDGDSAVRFLTHVLERLRGAPGNRC